VTLPRLKRRALLRGLGGLAVGLPALEAMSRSTAAAAPTPAPKRLVVFFTPNGTNANNSELVQPDFWPEQTGTSFTLGPEVAPLEPLRNQLLMVSGVNGDSMAQNVKDAFGDLHSIGLSQMLTGVPYVLDPASALPGSLPGGYAGGISVDQYIAKQIGSTTRFPSLEFGVVNATDIGVRPFSRMIYSGANQPVPAEQDPAAMYKRLFSDGTQGGTMMVERTLAEQKSVLDFVQGDFNRLEPQLGTSDRQKLDAHLTAIRELEMRLTPATATAAPASCSSVPGVTNAGDPLDKANFAVTGKLHMDLLALALKCDVTRVASLQWSFARSTLVHAWAGSTQGHHDMSHFGASAELTSVNTWYAQQLLYLGQALASVTDVDGQTLLDNTLIYWCSEVAWAYTHSFLNLRAVLLGGGGGALKTGQHINVGGQPHQKLLVTLLNAMGIMETTFGDAAYGSGPLPGVLA
jgi:Protein of unknown function (DUF1552)